MKSLTKVIVLVVVVGLLLGLSARGAAAQEERTGSRLAPSNLDFDLDDMDMKPLWRQNAIQRSKRRLRDIHYSGIYLALEAEDNSIMLVDAATGGLRSATALRSDLDLAPVDISESEVLLVVTGMLYKLDIETNELSAGWRMTLAPFTRPIVYDDFVISTDATGRIAAMDRETRRRSWMKNAAGPIMNRPELIGEKDDLLVAGFGGKVMRMDPESGAERWSWTPPEPGRLSTGIAVRGDTLYVGDLQGYVYALSTETAKVRWQQIAELGLFGQPVITNGHVLFLSSRPKLVCMNVDAEGDKAAWEMDGITRIVATGRKRVYVMNDDDTLMAVDVETGEVEWSDQLPRKTYITAGRPGEGVFFLADRTGAVVGFSESN